MWVSHFAKRPPERLLRLAAKSLTVNVSALEPKERRAMSAEIAERRTIWRKLMAEHTNAVAWAKYIAWWQMQTDDLMQRNTRTGKHQ